MKRYQPLNNYASDRQKRPRKPTHKSRLPRFVAQNKFVQKFSRLSRKKKVLVVGGAGATVLACIALFTIVFFANTLGSKEQIMNRNDTGVTLTDMNGTPFYEFYNAHSDTYIPLDQISPNVKEATLASEDKNFYKHPGFSPVGITNAIWQNIRPGGLRNGGSTLTQQLVKSALLSEKRSLLRKYQELILSIEIERRYSKDEVLEMYLNSVYFGEGSFGIEDAAQTYFGKSAKDLDEAQAAMLIGLLPAPSAYSPISGNPEYAKDRQTYVLGRMQEDGYITETEEANALAEPLSYNPDPGSQNYLAPHFALMVKDELEQKYGEEEIARSGYVVRTTLNLDWQKKSEEAVKAQVSKLASSKVSNGSAVIMDPKNGEIRALVGSKDWKDETSGKLNIVTAERQPGSSFKPIVYATGIENQTFSAATLMHDKATDFGGGYSPKNYDLRYRGNVTVRNSLAQSLNVPAVEALQETGINPVIQTAKKLGLTTLSDTENYGLPLALGTAQAKLSEMTNAYATFANGGKTNTITTIQSIRNKDNKELYAYKPKNEKVLSDQTSYIMSSILSDNTARAATFGSSLTLSGGRPAAVKTGTTESYRDAWTIGYTPSVAAGVWIGNNDNSPMNSVAGSSGAAPIWKNIMQQITDGTAVEQFAQAPGLTIRTICRGDGALASADGTNTMTEYFRPGTLPTTKCNEVKKEEPKQETPVVPSPTTPETKPTDNQNSGGGDDGDEPEEEPDDTSTNPDEGGNTDPQNPSLPNTPRP